MYKLYYACVCCSVVLFSSIDESADGEQVITSVLPTRIKKMFSDIAGIYKCALMIVYVLFISLCAFMHVSVSVFYVCTCVCLCVLCFHVCIYMYLSAHMCVYIFIVYLYYNTIVSNKFHMQKLYGNFFA